MRGDAIGEIQQRRDQSAGDEPRLDAHSEPRSSGIVERPRGGKRGSYGGGGKPDAHAEEFSDEQEPDGGPLHFVSGHGFSRAALRR